MPVYAISLFAILFALDLPDGRSAHQGRREDILIF